MLINQKSPREDDEIGEFGDADAVDGETYPKTQTSKIIDALDDDGDEEPDD